MPDRAGGAGVRVEKVARVCGVERAARDDGPEYRDPPAGVVR
uniref:Uncharacterized protein n=1 Tax=Streptomyces sp. NBC_01393 TaxID=2903851 RepID=A0AAU3I3Z3_9ACTN